MLAKRIIPCLDIKDGRTVKGVHFEHLRDAGDPVELAAHYSETGADELVFLDITATSEKRKTLKSLVERIARAIDIPFTVGGGIASVEDVELLLESGADKISVNTAGFRRPALIEELAGRFGSQCVVLAIDAKKSGENWKVFIDGGKTDTGIEVLEYARRGVEKGAGEILLTSMDRDGTKSGFDLELTHKLSSELPVPIIASGGAGSPEDFKAVFETGWADAALAASVFHFKEIEVMELKKYLLQNKLPIRL